MKAAPWLVSIGMALCLAAAAHGQTLPAPGGLPRSASDRSSGQQRVRPPAVAGQFYPADPAALRDIVDGFLAKAPGKGEANLRAIIVPHAGYPYSGQTAAFGFKQLAGLSFQTVVVIGPSHHVPLLGGALPNVDAFGTPLGLVPLSPACAAIAKEDGMSLNDAPHAPEHSLEVELPFLQRVLKDFSLVPIVYGEGSPALAARSLAKYLDANTLIVISTDLSHYYPSAVADQLDANCVQTILSLDADKVLDREACGRYPVAILLHLAKAMGWRAKLLNASNSGQATGDNDRVVGYAAIAFYGAPCTGQAPAGLAQDASAPKASTASAPQSPCPPAQPSAASSPAAAASGASTQPADKYSPQDRSRLLELARNALRESVASGSVPDVAAESLGANLRELKGCFVTLTVNGGLRGCIGNFDPQPLFQAVQHDARSAALQDFRFHPVKPQEVDAIRIEISVLTEPQLLTFSSSQDLLAKIRPGVDGLVLQVNGHQSTYLPQVWEQFRPGLMGKVDFLNSLSVKAGLAEDAWLSPNTIIHTYQVECFKEHEK